MAEGIATDGAAALGLREEVRTPNAHAKQGGRPSKKQYDSGAIHSRRRQLLTLRNLLIGVALHVEIL
jgi:hypothetical protein